MFRHVRAVLGVVLLLAAAAPSAAQDFSAARLSEGIRVLASDEFGGRYPGTEGEALTLDWLQARYEEMGLQPGAGEGRWLQPVDLAVYRPAWTAVASWTGSEGAGGHLDPVWDINVRAASGDGVATIEDAPVAFVGYGIHAPERDWDDYGDLDLGGKVLVALAGEPADPRFNGETPTVYETDRYKAREAFRRGAVGLLILRPGLFNPADPYTDPDAAVGYGLFGEPGLEFSGTINPQVIYAWARVAGIDLDAAMSQVSRGGFRALDLTGVRLNLQAGERIEVLRTYNLLARIPGTERPRETVIYSAHWDHVGARETGPPDADLIFNGAWDNASGTVAVVEMARALSQAPPPERSIVFAHMAAEELGLLGAFHYVAHPVWPLETTVANINLDMLPLSAPTRDLPVFGYGQTTLEDDLQALADRQGRTVTDDGQPEQGFYYRSDHYPFAEAGVPALMPWHGVDLIDGGRSVGEPAYRRMFTRYYHRAGDEWRPDMDFRAAIENLELLYALGLELANSEHWPGWKLGSEFGGTRKASAEARR